MPQLAGRKVPIRFLLVNVLLGAVLFGCGPIVQQAPFRQRPDSVGKGSLLGPFEGQVVDADTQLPLAEARVECSWAFDEGLGTSSPQGMRLYTTLTDADGRYRVPALSDFPQGLTSRLARMALVVYKQGYAAYRHERVFGRSSRASFSQLNNKVELIRWSPELSHARHLLFIGGGPALQQASAWEAAAAAAELAAGPALPLVPIERDLLAQLTGKPAELDAARLISSDMVREVTGYTGAFNEARLPGPRSLTYDTFHLRAVDRPERYDVAIRVWRASGGALDSRYEEILTSLPGSKQNDEVADRSFTAVQGEILGLGLLDRTTSAIVLLTCGRGQCPGEDVLLKLGQRIAANLSRLPAYSEEPAAPAAADEDEGQDEDPEQEEAAP